MKRTKLRYDELLAVINGERHVWRTDRQWFDAQRNALSAAQSRTLNSFLDEGLITTELTEPRSFSKWRRAVRTELGYQAFASWS